jgi:hypothetical protein
LNGHYPNGLINSASELGEYVMIQYVMIKQEIDKSLSASLWVQWILQQKKIESGTYDILKPS